MKKFITVAVLSLLLEVGIITVGASHANAAPISTTKRCVHDYVNGGKVCTRLVKHGAETRAGAEAYRILDQGDKYLPIDEFVKVTYLGWGSTNIQNGKDIWTVKSRIKAHRWHTYKIRVMTVTEAYEMGMDQGAEDLCQELGGTPVHPGKCDITLK